MIRVEADGTTYTYDLTPEAVEHSGGHLILKNPQGTTIARYRHWERWTDTTHLAEH
ncbi:hypothetical protein [Galactobacter caseinivorans]|uniref:hypothetical protein n=1 Tax=Galactobacter caseinivorans TaxID=2676123 RepID=UPI001314820D|nr:hypothetical protein [Galactobacter caseinivorans]